MKLDVKHRRVVSLSSKQPSYKKCSSQMKFMSAPALKQHLKKLPFISYPTAGNLPQLSHPNTWGWTLPLCLQIPRVGFVIHCTAAVSLPSVRNRTWMGVEETVLRACSMRQDVAIPIHEMAALQTPLKGRNYHSKDTAPLGGAQNLRLWALQLSAHRAIAIDLRSPSCPELQHRCVLPSPTPKRS